MNVLLVDDEYIVLKGMEAMLLSQKSLDLKVFTAGDAFEGLEQIPLIRPDVVIADVNMPEMDGLEMMEEAHRRGYRGKFMIVSGYERVDYLKRAIQQQAVDYLLKPVDKALLLQKLGEIAQECERRRETLLFRLKMCMLENRHKSDLSLDETAGAVGLQPSYLSSMFKKETGTTFLQYLHEERMKHACRLLSENPGLSIEQVARQSGYNTATYFHKVFRSQFGMSPNQWRAGGSPQDDG